MPKIVAIDLEGFKGSIKFKQPLYLDDVFAIENALDESANVEPSAFWRKINETVDKDAEVVSVSWSSRTDVIFLKAILQCVEAFALEGMAEKPEIETFPMTPRGAVTAFVKFAWDELQKIYNGDKEIPNG